MGLIEMTMLFLTIKQCLTFGMFLSDIYHHIIRILSTKFMKKLIYKTKIYIITQISMQDRNNYTFLYPI